MSILEMIKCTFVQAFSLRPPDGFFVPASFFVVQLLIYLSTRAPTPPTPPRPPLNIWCHPLRRRPVVNRVSVGTDRKQLPLDGGERVASVRAPPPGGSLSTRPPPSLRVRAIEPSDRSLNGG